MRPCSPTMATCMSTINPLERTLRELSFVGSSGMLVIGSVALNVLGIIVMMTLIPVTVTVTVTVTIIVVVPLGLYPSISACGIRLCPRVVHREKMSLCCVSWSAPTHGDGTGCFKPSPGILDRGILLLSAPQGTESGMAAQRGTKRRFVLRL